MKNKKRWNKSQCKVGDERDVLGVALDRICGFVDSVDRSKTIRKIHKYYFL